MVHVRSAPLDQPQLLMDQDALIASPTKFSLTVLAFVNKDLPITLLEYVLPALPSLMDSLSMASVLFAQETWFIMVNLVLVLQVKSLKDLFVFLNAKMMSF